MSISNYLEPRILDAVFNNTSLAIASVYVSLHSADPGETGASELTGGSYARSGPASFGVASGGAISNDAAIAFPEATGDWTAATHVGVWDASSAGNFLWGGALSASRTVTTGVTLSIASGDLDVTLD